MNVPSWDQFQELVDRVDELEARLAAAERPADCPFMTIPEAAAFLRTSRQRIDDLLSARRIERVKDGSRTLLRRADVLAYLEAGSNGRRSP
jgi:excisionase family DNA binding protein